MHDLAHGFLSRDICILRRTFAHFKENIKS